MHLSYEERLGHPADVRVKYRYFTQAEGNRNHLPFQGIRSDIRYEDTTETYIIWPELEDEHGNLIEDDTVRVPANGTARMWIINDARRPIHQNKIKIGKKGFFIEGLKVAECEVIEIVGLMTNPTTRGG